MKQNNQNFPYPVLIKGSQDYVNSSFSIMFSSLPKECGGYINFSISYELNCVGLQEMLNKKEAAVVLQVLCSETSYRKLFTFESQDIEISLNKKEFIGKIIINSFIVALEDKNNYLLKEHNSLYFSTEQTINKGDKLAIGETLSFKLNKYDSLRPISSIVLIKLNKLNKVAVDVDLSGEKIVIFLSKEIFDEYKMLREYPKLRSYLSVNLVLPAIAEALFELKNNYESLDQDKKWVFTLNKMLKSLDIDILATDLSCYSIANIIFKNGISYNLKTLENFFLNIKEE